jgi:two-component system, LytTR family, sensor kinase
MPHSLHEPLLINTVGHCAGALIFGILLYLFLLAGRRPRAVPPIVASALALIWNLGSLIVLLLESSETFFVSLVVAVSFAALSALPAVLLQISLGGRARPLAAAGYLVSGAAVALHAMEAAGASASLHRWGLLIITAGFGALTVLSVLSIRRTAPDRSSWRRAATAMCLFLFAVSFVHFGPAHGREAWSGEIALHHAGLPLALFVLLQDYRFLLLDTFVRFVVNGTLAAATVYVVHALESRLHFMGDAASPALYGLAFMAACVLLILFALLRESVQRWLTHAVFRRPNVDEAVARLRALAQTRVSEQSYLERAARFVRRYAGAARHELVMAPDFMTHSTPAILDGSPHGAIPAWAAAVIPVRFAVDDTCAILLGERRGGRRYLSEDLDALAKLSSTIGEEVTRLRENRMQELVIDAELRALQAQINPHFLFNSLNTLYGTISRSNAEARQLVLNLAEVFRYSLRSDRGFVTVEQEMAIVRAYLAIEALRLGPRLQVDLNVDPAALSARIPALVIQPLVENAVKHGAAAMESGGFVRATVRREEDRVLFEVENSGEFGANPAPADGFGIGMNNVRARLRLCYGEQAGIDVTSRNGITVIRFEIPAPSAAPERVAQ